MTFSPSYPVWYVEDKFCSITAQQPHSSKAFPPISVIMVRILWEPCIGSSLPRGFLGAIGQTLGSGMMGCAINAPSTWWPDVWDFKGILRVGGTQMSIKPYTAVGFPYSLGN
jgi:hypothetical protein